MIARRPEPVKPLGVRIPTRMGTTRSTVTRGPGAALLAVSVLAGCRQASTTTPRPSTSVSPSTVANTQPGQLLVTALRPDATVFLDGRRLGAAPQHADGLSPGSHEVRVEKQGFRPFRMQVQILPGREARVEARLEPESSRLSVKADVVGAQVFLDRKSVGTAPVDLELTPGPHRLNVSAEGYEMYAEDVDVPSGQRDVMVRFREVRLDAGVDVVHKHGIGSCQGRLTATPAGIRYQASRRADAFDAPLDTLEHLEVDYLAKTLRVSLRGGRSYNFTTRDPSADGLLVFQKQVEQARQQLTGPEGSRGGSAGPARGPSPG
jgi:PEGA domain